MFKNLIKRIYSIEESTVMLILISALSVYFVVMMLYALSH